MRLKGTLESKTEQAMAQLEALERLKAMGSLPTKVLSETVIGKTVNQIAKACTEPAVRSAAKELVDGWRQTHRKRKSSSNLGGDDPLLKRVNSISSDFTPLASQASEDLSFGDGILPAHKTVSARPSQEDLGADGTAEATADAKLEPWRDKVRLKLIEALGKDEDIETKGGPTTTEETQRDPVVLAAEIEDALGAAYEKKEAYLSQARSVLYNLKDSKNPTFRFKLMVGFFQPSDVPNLTAEDMASDEKNAERAAQRKFAMEEIQSDWAVKHGQGGITGMFTCGKCKGVKTTYFQMQTRSSDEPMTTFVSCLSCNNRWKFC